MSGPVSEAKAISIVLFAIVGCVFGVPAGCSVLESFEANDEQNREIKKNCIEMMQDAQETILSAVEENDTVTLHLMKEAIQPICDVCNTALGKDPKKSLTEVIKL